MEMAAADCQKECRPQPCLRQHQLPFSYSMETGRATTLGKGATGMENTHQRVFCSALHALLESSRLLTDLGLLKGAAYMPRWRPLPKRKKLLDGT